MAPAVKERTVIALAILYAVSKSKRIDWGSGWHWPVPDLRVAMRGESALGEWPATISQEYREANHKGVDIMYRRQGATDLMIWPGLSRWFAPEGTPILAARAGVVWGAVTSPVGGVIALDHGSPWATRYLHLATMDVKRGDVVREGQRIGTMGYNPNTDPARGVVDAAKIVHLHFEVMHNAAVGNVDPAPAMAGWARSTWTP